MRKQYLAIGAYAASLAMLASPALAQNTSSTPATYQAARAAGAAAQKVAPPNLVMPADMGGGTFGQRQTQNTAPNTGPSATSPMPPATTNTTMPSNSGMTTPSTSATTTPSNTGTAAPGSMDSNNNAGGSPAAPASASPGNGNSATSPNTKLGH